MSALDKASLGTSEYESQANIPSVSSREQHFSGNYYEWWVPNFSLGSIVKKKLYDQHEKSLLACLLLLSCNVPVLARVSLQVKKAWFTPRLTCFTGRGVGRRSYSALNSHQWFARASRSDTTAAHGPQCAVDGTVCRCTWRHLAAMLAVLVTRLVPAFMHQCSRGYPMFFVEGVLLINWQRQTLVSTSCVSSLQFSKFIILLSGRDTE